MLDTNNRFWEDRFSIKFTNFCKKSPVLLTMSIIAQNLDRGVLVTHVNSGAKYFFEFNYNMNPKDFIANIKSLLVGKHYPRLIEEILEKHQLTSDELAKKVEDGANLNALDKYEMRVSGTRMYRFDKILAWKQIAILTLESSDIPGDEIGASYQYKFQGGSLVIFLKNYRTGKFKTLESASEHFFSNALNLGKIVSKDLPEEQVLQQTP